MDSNPDVENAFDRVHHADLFRTLLSCGVSTRIVVTLQDFYAGLRARVQLWPGTESRDFPLQRGVRQGDPLSSLLFNLVLDQILTEVQETWQRRGYGTDVGMYFNNEARLTHIAFADDMTLVARTWLSIKRMIISLREALSKRGISLHPSKCKVQANSRRGMTAVSDYFSV